MNISLIAGARPNFMKIAPLVRALEQRGVQPRIVHTGQHYDRQMSETFFKELNIPEPDINLEVGSGGAVWQITEVMRRLEEDFTDHPPQVVVVVGDVNSTMAAALTATKLGIPLAHVEAGLRSFDRAMPEETNRLVTDTVADWLFTSEPSGDANLHHEGVPPEKIHLVGNVMIDTLLAHLERARSENPCAALGVSPKEFALLTLHRPSNVDDPERFESILRAIHKISEQLPILFPIHPRSRTRIEEFGFADRSELGGFTTIEPLGYHAMLGLLDAARLVLTDSGGIQEETTVLQVPCLTIRENTERPVTVEIGSNQLVGWQTEDILAPAQQILAAAPGPRGQVPENWDGRAAERIAEILLRDLSSG